jgi:hypothetical protein
MVLLGYVKIERMKTLCIKYASIFRQSLFLIMNKIMRTLVQSIKEQVPKKVERIAYRRLGRAQ